MKGLELKPATSPSHWSAGAGNARGGGASIDGPLDAMLHADGRGATASAGGPNAFRGFVQPDLYSTSGELWPGRSAIQTVCKNVLITNYFGAKNLPLLLDHEVTHIVVCANELPCAFPASFRYLRLDGLTDNTHTDLFAHIDVALPWMTSAIQQGGRVLVHCAAGSSRSGSIIVAYLMQTQNLSFSAALSVAKKARPVIELNPGFAEQLSRYPLVQEHVG